MAEKVYTKGVFINEKDSSFGKFLNMDFKTSEFIEFLNANTNDKGYCKITVYKAKEGGKNSHYGVLNNFVPTQSNPNTHPAQGVSNSESDDSLPF